MATFYLVNSVVADPYGQGARMIRSGTLLSDSKVIAAVQAAGGQIVDSANPNVAAAAVIVNKLRAKQGQDEDFCDKVMLAAFSASAGTQHLTIDVPLTAINAATSGTPFNIGAVLPTNMIITASDINLIQVIAGGSVATSCVAKVQNTGETAGALLGGAAGTNVFTGATLGKYGGTGSNPYGARGGQQLQMTITAGAGALSTATTGHLAVDLYYTAAPLD